MSILEYKSCVLDEDFSGFQELQDLFAAEKYSSKIAVIYDDGENAPETQTYGQVNSMADIIKCYLESCHSGDSKTGGFVGVACSQTVIYPAVLLGVLRAKYGFHNIDQSRLLEDIKFSQSTIALKILLIEDSIFQKFNLKLKPLVKEKIGSYEYKEDMKNCIVHIFLLQDPVINYHYYPKNNSSSQYAYAICTSGTTGSKKMVLVPNSCIVPNITYFIHKIWKMKITDVVFGASPVTFDPSIVELFSALGSGATILYVPLKVKLVGDLLAKILARHKVTLLQITPSLFRRISPNLIDEGIFNYDKSFLEVLAFGGEECLQKSELKKIIDSKMFGKLQQRGLQNLYGTTEVSCWASVENINLESECDITIGSPILNTCIYIGEDGNISIGSETRVCTILNSSGDEVSDNFKKDNYCFFDTGDIGIFNEETHGIKYVTRKDRIVKRNGYKTSLVEIENSAMATKLLDTAICVFYKDKIYLVVKLISSTSTSSASKRICSDFIPKLRLDIPPQIYPDVIVPMEEIPVNQNGKIDMNRILSTAEYQRELSHVHFNFQQDLFLQALENIWLMCTNPRGRTSPSNENAKSYRFLEAGGDSLSAVRFIEEALTYLNLFGSDTHAKFEKEIFNLLILEDFSKVANFLCEIGQRNPVNVSVAHVSPESNMELVNCPKNDLENLDNGKYPLELAADKLNQESPLTTLSYRKRKLPKTTSSIISSKIPPEIIYSFSYDLRMCVDSSTVVVDKLNFLKGALLIIGSHSGYVVGILILIASSSARSSSSSNLFGESRFPVLWEIQLGGRVEATAAIHPNNLTAYIGTHNKRLYSVSTLTGNINWRYECNDSVRAAPIVTPDGNGLVFVDEYAMYCLNSHNGELFWKLENLKHMSTCSPAITDAFVFATTVTNKIEAIDIRTGNKAWTREDKSSDMTKAYCTALIIAKLEGDKRLLLAGTRNGRLDALNPQNGEIIWTCQDLQVDKFNPNTVPFAPLTHVTSCDHCDCGDSFIIFINRKGKGLMLCPETGIVLKLFELNLNLSASPCIMCTKNTSQSFEASDSTEEPKRIPCADRTQFMVFYTEAVLTLVNIKDHSLRYDLQTDFDTEAINFSKPVVYKNYVSVGGRDNKLHIFELAST